MLNYLEGTVPKVVAFTVSNYDVLGEYRREERCKEILLEIMKKAEVGHRVYYMPEE